MLEERIRELADNLLSCIEEFPDCSNSHYRTRLNYAIEHIKAAIKESSEGKDEVIRRLSLATDSEVGSCDCLTKSPDIQHHKKGCKYRLIVERDEARKLMREYASEVERLKGVNETPCAHEWYLGQCCHCAIKVSDVHPERKPY